MNSSDTELVARQGEVPVAPGPSGRAAPPAPAGQPGPTGTGPAIETPAAAEGLTTEEARRRLQQFGYNEVEERRVPAWRRLAGRFWGPLPWMLEATILLTLLLGKDVEAVIITVLLVLNSVIGYLQQSRADEALRLLRRRLAINARVRRDGRWLLLPARDVVPGDAVRVRVGDLVPADLQLVEGHVSLDQSALTGESLPVDAGPGEAAFGAAVVTRGEATGTVTATASSSYFGRTTALVGEARTATHLEQVIFQIVRYLIVIDVALVAVMLAVAAMNGTPLSDAAPFALIILIASVPVALPTTFTVAQAVGALELSRGSQPGRPGHGVLVTRLSAVQEGASMDVLCTDKTGTLTTNELTLQASVTYPAFEGTGVVALAGIASDESGQDPIDLALLRAAPAGSESGKVESGCTDRWRRLAFTPFDPSTKRTEAVVEGCGRRMHVVKGMPQVVAARCVDVPASLESDVDRLAASGARVLAVAAGPAGPDATDPAAPNPAGLAMAGLVALSDRPRPDSAHVVRELGSLGIEVKMVTGDTPSAATSVARQVGLDPRVCTGAELRERPELADRCNVFTAVFPEDKHTLVRSLQQAGHVVGMTGDGVNDAPALKQAEVGIAVDRAVDVAKGAASMVLTDPGLVDIVAAVTTSRRIYQRMMTWTLNKIVKTAQVAVFLTLAFVVTGNFVTTPLLVVLLLLANDFVTMSLAVDHARPSPRPERWRVGAIVGASLALALVVLAESFLDLGLARGIFHLTWPQTQTLVFLMLVFSGQATVYVVRERDRFWKSRPVGWLLLATCADIIVVTVLATGGILMTPVAFGYVLLVLVIAGAFMFVMDPLKVRVLHRFSLA